jgi:hypothetical protein
LAATFVAVESHRRKVEVLNFWSPSAANIYEGIAVIFRYLFLKFWN